MEGMREVARRGQGSWHQWRVEGGSGWFHMQRIGAGGTVPYARWEWKKLAVQNPGEGGVSFLGLPSPLEARQRPVETV